MKQMITVSALCLTLVACSGKESPKIAAMQKKDKTLSCREVLLEQNEAEFYRSSAEKNKTPGVGSLLMPLGYVSTYMKAEDAAGAADDRIGYLARVYEIMDCDNKLEMAERQSKMMNRQMATSMAKEQDGPMVASMQQQVPQPYMMQAQPMMMPMQPMAYQQMRQAPVQGPSLY